MDKGESIAIVILPGLDGTGELLTGLVGRLSPRHSVQVIAYPTDKHLVYDELIAFVLEQAPKGRYVIVGESFSGPVAIEVAARDQRVAGLVLASSFARHPLPRIFAPFVWAIDVKWIPNRIVAYALLGSAGTDQMKSQLSRVLIKLPSGVIRARVSDVLRVDKRRRLSEVTCPVMCVHGRYDRLVSKKCVDEIVLAQPACQVDWLDAPHMLLETHADEAAEAINRFCERLN